MKNRKVQYHKESKLWEYTIEAFECSCKCNVFHKEYDGKHIYYVCNSCQTDVATLKDEYLDENLQKGIWKHIK